MPEMREIEVGSTVLAVPALQPLRPSFDPDELVQIVDGRLRPAGYRLVGAFDDPHVDAQAVAGFRETYALVRGPHLVVDEMVTLPGSRGRGLAGLLVDWLVDEGTWTGCRELHLDSAVGPERAAAHRLYHRYGLHISAHHFHRDLPG